MATKTFIANIKGAKGVQGDTGAQGLPGTGAVPADAAVAGYISTAGTSDTQTAADARYASTAILAAATDRDRITRLFQSSGTRVAVKRVGNDYNMHQEVSPNVWWKQTLANTTTATGTLHVMKDSIVGRPVASLAHGDASFAYSATGWGVITNAMVYGGNYQRNKTIGATVTWTSPTATHVGIRGILTNNGGYAKVTLDGSVTAATLLPTAQDEVTAGRLASSALVANGGTLNPTDRVYDSYASPTRPDGITLFADGLTSAAHTVILTVTGYKQTPAVDVYVLLTGGISGTASTALDTAGVEIAALVTAHTGSSVYEYAMVFKRTGGTLAPFIGNSHGNETETYFGIIVDGKTVTFTDGQTRIGSAAQIERGTNLLNPDNAAEVVATGSAFWTITAANGIDLHWVVNWTKAGTVSSAYAAMLPTQGNTFQRGRAAGGSTVILLDDDNSVKGSTKSDTIVLWQSGGNGATMLTVRNLPQAVNSWANTATDFAWIQDRSGGDYNKGYFQRIQAVDVPIVIGDKWETFATYRAAWLPTTSALQH